MSVELPNSSSPPIVSVLMPTYNDGRYLRDAIDSILLQTFSYFELIIVDDGSTDDTPLILSEYMDSRIRIITLPENMGRPTARNTALEAATGKYIAWMDADDISMPKRLEKQVAFMEANPDIAVCSGAILNFFNIDGLHVPPLDSDSIRAGLFWGSTIPNPASLMRREMVAASGARFDLQLSRAQDYDFWCALLLDHRLKASNLPDILLLYRRTKKTFQADMHDAVLRKNLQRLNIPETEETMGIYKVLTYDDELKSKYPLSSIQIYIKTVISANKKLQVFPHTIFVQNLYIKSFTLTSKILDSKLKLLYYAIQNFPINFVFSRIILSLKAFYRRRKKTSKCCGWL